MNIYFNKSVKINNPLRIFFLCGSTYQRNSVEIKIKDKEYVIEDKRKVLQKYLENKYINKNYRSIILEENFMFSNSNSGTRKRKRILNYKHINLKSLKSIELLTSLYSDYVLILHESFSTAAEIGIFSSSDFINNKLIILTPNIFSVEEDYISGFMKLAYSQKGAHYIKTINYNPGIYHYHVSDHVRKLHTFFIGNEVTGKLSRDLSNYFDDLGPRHITFGTRKGIHNSIKSYYKLYGSKKINIILDSNDLLSYLIALFNIPEFRTDFVRNVDMSVLIKDNEPNRRKKLFNEGSIFVEKYFKQALYNTLKLDIPNLDKDYGTFEQSDKFISISINQRVVGFSECISYYLYILYALSYINIKDKNTRFSISNSFQPIFKEYKNVIKEVGSTKMWRES